MSLRVQTVLAEKLLCQYDVLKVTHTHTQLFYSSLDFVRYNLVEPVPEETFTHSHLLWSSIVTYLLHPSNMIHGILPVQSTCLTVIFHNLSSSFLWSTSWPGTLHHTFLHPIIVFFLQHMPIPSQPGSASSHRFVLLYVLELYLWGKVA